MLKHILVAYDGSQPANKAFAFALDLAKKYKSKMTVLAIARLPEPADDVETEALLELAKQRYKKLFEKLAAKTKKDPKVKIQFKIVVGHPAEQIVDHAESLKADHIVMGHRGKAIFKRWLMGSVAKQVMIYANCGITIVR